jgi:hypothetical protein
MNESGRDAAGAQTWCGVAQGYEAAVAVRPRKKELDEAGDSAAAHTDIWSPRIR